MYTGINTNAYRQVCSSYTTIMPFIVPHFLDSHKSWTCFYRQCGVVTHGSGMKICAADVRSNENFFKFFNNYLNAPFSLIHATYYKMPLPFRYTAKKICSSTFTGNLFSSSILCHVSEIEAYPFLKRLTAKGHASTLSSYTDYL